MKKTVFIFCIGIVALVLPRVACAQNSADSAKLSATATESPAAELQVTVVYGISADDYLPSARSLKNQARPKPRKTASRPSFHLPDAFYFIGGPIFIFLFLSILVVFLNEFEEKRKEEMRAMARDTMEGE